MDIKFFKVGQEVWELDEERLARGNIGGKRQMIVRNIGRIYLKASIHGSKVCTEYYGEVGKNYLIEREGSGTSRKLFPDKQSMDDYVEAKTLRKELYRKFNSMRTLERLTLGQLRHIRDLIGDD